MEKNIKKPFLSAVLPVYNSEKFLPDTINSVLNQTFKNFEFIIIDDDSTDNSLKIIRKYAAKDKRIKVIKNKKNIGFPSTLNVGLKNAKGKYIVICNSDDLSHPRRFEIQVNYLEKNPNIFLIGTSAIVINEKGEKIDKFPKYNNYKVLAWRLKKSNGIVHPSTMFRNEGFFFNKEYGGATDYDFYYQLLTHNKNLTNITQFLVKYRIHSGSMSIYNRKQQEELRDKVLKKFKNIKEDINFLEKATYPLKLLFYYIISRIRKRI